MHHRHGRTGNVARSGARPGELPAAARIGIGIMLDHGETGWTLWLMAAAALLAIGVTFLIARLTVRRA